MSLCGHFDEVTLCYIAAALTCTGAAAADIVGRFKSGNRIKSIMWGMPQCSFYLLNACAGLFALFSSEALGATQIFSAALSNLPLAITKSVGIAVATFLSLRVTLNTVPTTDGKRVEFGPGRLFATLLENIERRIDRERMKQAAKDINKIAPLLSPRAVLNVVLPFCINQAEKDVGDHAKITETLEAMYNSTHDISPDERSALMLNLLYPIFGSSVLEAAIELVTKEHVSPSTQGGIGLCGGGISNALQLSEKALDELIQQLRSKHP